MHATCHSAKLDSATTKGSVQKMKQPRAVWLDFIRVFACFCIIVVHFNASVSGWNIYGGFVLSNSLTPNWYLGAYLGDIGSSLFFMVSGASLMISNDKTTLKDFYLKRFLGIYPMLWIAYTAVTLLSFILNRAYPMSKLSLLIFSFAGLDGYFGVLGLIDGSFFLVGEWFLGCIILIYLVWPLLREGLNRAPILTWIVSLALLLYYSGRNSIMFPARFAEVLFGMTVVKYKLNEKSVYLLSGTAVCALIVYLLMRRGNANNFLWTVAFCGFLFAALLVLSCLIHNEKIKSFLVWFGGLSYPIFLLHHWIINKLVQNFDLTYFPYRYTVLMFSVYLCLTLGASIVLKKVGDQFTRTLKRKLLPSRA